MAIEWDPRLSTGVAAVDQQHQELFRRVNALLEALAEGKGKQVVGDLLNFLKDYVVEHFGTEQRLMAQHAYPQLAAHKLQHDEFVKTFLALHAGFEKDGPTMSLTVTINKLVCTWLREHIGTVDRALGQFMTARSPQRQA